MLVKVSVENFKSFDKAAELTMISSNKIRTNANHRLKIKSTQLLKYAVVYGANTARISFLLIVHPPVHPASDPVSELCCHLVSVIPPKSHPLSSAASVP